MESLKKAGLAEMAKEKFAGMMVLEVLCTNEQKDSLLLEFPTAKYDSSTTHSIELLPKEVKDTVFQESIKLHSTGSEVVEEFLTHLNRKNR